MEIKALRERSHKSQLKPVLPKTRERISRVFVPVAPAELSSYERIDWALRAILSDVKKHQGRYPFSQGAPKIVDVLQRAGLSKCFLEKQGGDLTREAQKSWHKKKIKRVLRRIKSGRYFSSGDRSNRSSSPPSASWLSLKSQLDSLRQAWVEEELVYIDAQNRIEELDAQLNEQRAENARLVDMLADAGIHFLR